MKKRSVLASILAVLMALALTACTPKEKHLVSGAAIGAAAGAAGAAVLNQDPLAGASDGGYAGIEILSEINGFVVIHPVRGKDLCFQIVNGAESGALKSHSDVGKP